GRAARRNGAGMWLKIDPPHPAGRGTAEEPTRMSRLHPGRICRLALMLASILGSPLAAQPVDPALLSHPHWRMIGPFRGGRTVAAVGVPGQPDLFYIGVNNGGVWKTTDS